MNPSHTCSICIALSALFIVTPLLAQRADVPLNEVGRRLMLAAPAPEYPLEARQKLIMGRGKYQLIFRPETGVVTRVTVLQSTGSKILDDAAVKALSRWRARPGRVSRMHVPVTFTLVR